MPFDPLIGALTTAEWLVAVGSGVLLLLSIVPVVLACWYFVEMSDDAYARQVADVERFIELRDAARRAMR